MTSIPEFYTEQVATVGQVKRIYFYCRVILITGESQWHYFGTDPVEYPPFNADPVFEHDYIQFPGDLDSLPINESESYLYELGKLAGFAKEGIV